MKYLDKKTGSGTHWLFNVSLIAMLSSLPLMFLFLALESQMAKSVSVPLGLFIMTTMIASVVGTCVSANMKNKEFEEEMKLSLLDTPYDIDPLGFVWLKSLPEKDRHTSHYKGWDGRYRTPSYSAYFGRSGLTYRKIISQIKSGVIPLPEENKKPYVAESSSLTAPPKLPSKALLNSLPLKKVSLFSKTSFSVALLSLVTWAAFPGPVVDAIARVLITLTIPFVLFAVYLGTRGQMRLKHSRLEVLPTLKGINIYLKSSQEKIVNLPYSEMSFDELVYELQLNETEIVKKHEEMKKNVLLEKEGIKSIIQKS